MFSADIEMEYGSEMHLVKSVRIRSFSGPYFPTLGLKMTPFCFQDE